jgi:hypothetical protein
MGRPAADGASGPGGLDRRPRGGRKHRKPGANSPQSAFAEELAKAL